MPTPTYTLIEEQALGSAVANVTLGSGGTIPQTFTHLVVESVFASGSATAVEQLVRFNGDTASNYSDTYVYGNGTNALSGRDSTQSWVRCGITSSTELNTFVMHLMSYTNTNVYKSLLVRQGTANAGSISAYAGLWRNTAAITSILINNSQNFAVGSTFRLWGIAG